MAINIKTRREFIDWIFDFFRVERNNNQVSAYDMALTVKYPVDWNAFYLDVVKTNEKRVLPMPKYFVDKLPQFKKIMDLEPSLSNGSLIRVILKDGIFYDFTVNNLVTCPTLSDIKRRFEYKDLNNKTQSNIKKIIRYPKETTIIGDAVFFNVTVPNAARMTAEEREREEAKIEEELRSQIRVLFEASEN